MVQAPAVSKAVDSKKYKSLLSIKQDKTLVICFGLFVVSQHKIDMYGEDGTSLDSNRDFLEACLYLAEHLPNHHLVFRFKLNLGAEDVIDELLQQRIDLADNFEIQWDLKRYNSYEMAHLADVVIGKQSLIMEECFCQKKKILFYDSEHWLSAFDYVLYELDIIAKTHDELLNKVRDISQGQYLEEKRWDQVIRDFYFPNSEKDPNTEMKRNLRQFL